MYNHTLHENLAHAHAVDTRPSPLAGGAGDEASATYDSHLYMHIPIILSTTDKSYYYDIRVEMDTWKLDGKCLLSLLALSSSC